MIVTIGGSVVVNVGEVADMLPGLHVFGVGHMLRWYGDEMAVSCRGLTLGRCARAAIDSLQHSDWPGRRNGQSLLRELVQHGPMGVEVTVTEVSQPIAVDHAALLECALLASAKWVALTVQGDRVWRASALSTLRRWQRAVKRAAKMGVGKQ